MVKYAISVFMFTVSVILIVVCSTTLSLFAGTSDKTCCVCHSVSKSLTPASHIDIEEVEESVRVRVNGIFNDINKGIFLATHHARNDISCSDCHGEDMLDIGMEVENEVCFSCHESYESLAEQTENIMVEEQNPHRSHLGELDCSVCHHVHSRSRSYCLECHSNFNMPMLGD